MTEPGHRLLSAAEVADILGKSERTVRRHAATGQIPIVGRLGPQELYVFDPEAVQDYIDGTT